MNNIFFTGLYLLCVINFFSCNSTNSRLHEDDFTGKDTENTHCKEVFDTILNRKIYDQADVLPSFPGGTSKLMSFINSELHYPNSQQEVQGKVCVSFIVEIDGTLTNKQICEKSKEEYTEVEKAVLKILDKMPLWKPGNCNKQAVAFRYILPIYIKPGD